MHKKHNFTHRKNISHMAWLLPFMMVMFCRCASNDYHDTIYYKRFVSYHNARVNDVIAYTKNNIRDYNKDGDVNCQDYTLVFYYRWKELYGSSDIGIVRNENVNGTPHVFIRIRCFNCFEPKKQWYYVEPQAPGGTWDMHDVWGEKYNPSLNDYDSDRWLKRISKGN